MMRLLLRPTTLISLFALVVAGVLWILMMAGFRWGNLAESLTAALALSVGAMCAPSNWRAADLEPEDTAVRKGVQIAVAVTVAFVAAVLFSRQDHMPLNPGLPAVLAIGAAIVTGALLSIRRPRGAAGTTAGTRTEEVGAPA